MLHGLQLSVKVAPDVLRTWLENSYYGSPALIGGRLHWLRKNRATRGMDLAMLSLHFIKLPKSKSASFSYGAANTPEL